MLFQRLILQRIGKVYAVSIGKFTMLITVDKVHSIVLYLTFLVWFLYAAARRGVVMSHCEAYHGAVRQVYRALHEALSERATAYDGAAILVLNGTRDNLCRRCGVFIDEHYHLSVEETPVASRPELLSSHGTTLCIYEQIVLGQQLIEHFSSSLQITSAIVFQVNDEVFHAAFIQAFQRVEELTVGRCAKGRYLYVSHRWAYHVESVNGVERNLVSDNGEIYYVLDAVALNANLHLSAFRPSEAAHYLLFRHLYACYGSVIDRHEAVAGQDADLLRRAVVDGLHHEERVLKHIELHSHTLKVALQGLIEGFHLLGCGVRRVGIKLLYHSSDGILHQFLAIHAIHIELLCGHNGNGKFLQFSLSYFRITALSHCADTCRQQHQQRQDNLFHISHFSFCSSFPLLFLIGMCVIPYLYIRAQGVFPLLWMSFRAAALKMQRPCLVRIVSHRAWPLLRQAFHKDCADIVG